MDLNDINIKKLKKLIIKKKIISFDIFDTLILRPFCNPNDLFKYIEKNYKIKDFSKERIRSWGVAKNKIIGSNREEITLDEIYCCMNKKFEKCKSIEKNEEIKLCYANPIAKEIYFYARSLRKKIILISDMYLDRATILKILNKNGFYNFDLFISSELGFIKGTGNLYKKIIKDNKYNSKDILHIGDNLQADCEAPKKIGIRTFYLSSPLDCLFRHFPSIKAFYNQNQNSLSISMFVSTLKKIVWSKTKNYWYVLGYVYGGPVINSYTRWLINDFKKRNYSAILFMARDGYNIKRVYDYICNQENPKSFYIYGNRSFDLIRKLDFKKYKKYQNIYRDVLNTIRTFYSDYFHELTCKKYNNAIELEKWIVRNKKLLLKLSHKYIDEYKSYVLNSCKGNSVALVDGMTTEFTSYKLINNILGKKLKHCYYYFIDGNKNIDNNFFSTFQIERHQLYYDWDFMEFIMSAPEPSANAKCSGTFTFKKETKKCKYRERIYNDFSDGILAYSKINNISCDDKVIADFINSLSLNHSNAERRLINKIYFDHFCGEKFLPLCYRWKLKFSLKRIIKKMLICFSNSFYKIFKMKPYKKVVYKNKLIYLLFGFFPLYYKDIRN